jgi:hypothetical protein
LNLDAGRATGFGAHAEGGPGVFQFTIRKDHQKSATLPRRVIDMDPEGTAFEADLIEVLLRSLRPHRRARSAHDCTRDARGLRWSHAPEDEQADHECRDR